MSHSYLNTKFTTQEIKTRYLAELNRLLAQCGLCASSLDRRGKGATMIDSIQTQRAQFLENGYDPIPLKPNDKHPAAGAWERRSTAAQWDYAQSKYETQNIGLRAGNGKAFIDCDDKATPGTAD